MAQAREIIKNWRIEYNTERTHSCLGDLTPEEFVAEHRRRNEKSVSLTADSNPNRY